mgnify:CR=1 FL=1
MTARAPESWFPGGDIFSYITLKDGGDYDLWSYSFRDRTARALVALPTSAQLSSRISPDGRWIAYESNESGRPEIYVRDFPLTDRKVRISTGGGTDAARP